MAKATSTQEKGQDPRSLGGNGPQCPGCGGNLVAYPRWLTCYGCCKRWVADEELFRKLNVKKPAKAVR